MSADNVFTVMTGRVIALKYLMLNRAGEVLEDRSHGDPAVYLQGGKEILPVLQEGLEGMKPGQKKQLTLRIGTGEQFQEFRFDVEVVSVRLATDAELQLGYPLPVAEDCGPDCACYDSEASLK